MCNYVLVIYFEGDWRGVGCCLGAASTQVGCLVWSTKFSPTKLTNMLGEISPVWRRHYSVVSVPILNVVFHLYIIPTFSLLLYSSVCSNPQTHLRLFISIFSCIQLLFVLFCPVFSNPKRRLSLLYLPPSYFSFSYNLHSVPILILIFTFHLYILLPPTFIFIIIICLF